VMAIEYHPDPGVGGGQVRTVACPFCGAEVGGRRADLPHHLREECEELR